MGNQKQLLTDLDLTNLNKEKRMLRSMLRYKQTYMTFCRAYSKTFTGTLALICKAILYPGIALFTVAPGKQQSAKMLSEKIKQLTTMIPALSKEILWDTRGLKDAVTRQTKDSVVYTFRNGSTIENIAMSENTRGARYQSGNMEECATLDQDILQQVIIPTLNISRSINGKTDPNEIVNQSQIYLTSAGYKGTYAYDKLIETFCKCVAKPEDYLILGGDWRMPTKFGAFSKQYLQELRNDGTMNEGTFDREFKLCELNSLNTVNCWKALRAA